MACALGYDLVSLRDFRIALQGILNLEQITMHNGYWAAWAR